MICVITTPSARGQTAAMMIPISGRKNPTIAKPIGDRPLRCARIQHTSALTHPTMNAVT